MTLSMDELTLRAERNVEAHLADAVAEGDDLAEAVYTLAYDAVVDAGGEISTARIIAGYMRTRY